MGDPASAACTDISVALPWVDPDPYKSARLHRRRPQGVPRTCDSCVPFGVAPAPACIAWATLTCLPRDVSRCVHTADLNSCLCARARCRRTPAPAPTPAPPHRTAPRHSHAVRHAAANVRRPGGLVRHAAAHHHHHLPATGLLLAAGASAGYWRWFARRRGGDASVGLAGVCRNCHIASPVLESCPAGSWGDPWLHMHGQNKIRRQTGRRSQPATGRGHG